MVAHIAQTRGHTGWARDISRYNLQSVVLSAPLSPPSLTPKGSSAFKIVPQARERANVQSNYSHLPYTVPATPHTGTHCLARSAMGVGVGYSEAHHCFFCTAAGTVWLSGGKMNESFRPITTAGPVGLRNPYTCRSRITFLM